MFGTRLITIKWDFCWLRWQHFYWIVCLCANNVPGIRTCTFGLPPVCLLCSLAVAHLCAIVNAYICVCPCCLSECRNYWFVLDGKLPHFHWRNIAIYLYTSIRSHNFWFLVIAIAQSMAKLAAVVVVTVMLAHDWQILLLIMHIT